MNPLSTVLFALQGCVSAIRLTEVFIKSENVKHVLEEVATAIEGAIKALSPHAALSPKASIFYSEEELEKKAGEDTGEAANDDAQKKGE